MRVLFTCVAATGHFHPLVPLARALDAAGHDVAFVSGPTLAPKVTASGFALFEAGMDARTVFVEHPEIIDLAPLARNEVWLRRQFPEWLAQRLGLTFRPIRPPPRRVLEPHFARGAE